MARINRQIETTTLVLFCFSTIVSSSSAQEITPRFDSLKEVVVTASRFAENLLVAPVTISKLSSAELRHSAHLSIYYGVGSLKGVHMITPSLGFKILNTRGFSNTTNVRFVQLIDYIDNQSPHIGAPIANALSPSDLDIANVEIIQGVASALYGMNATMRLMDWPTLLQRTLLSFQA